MTDNEKGCHNCVHRFGLLGREFWECSRTGFHTSTEMRYGGRCADGLELRLWAPRPALLHRIMGLVRPVADAKASSDQDYGGAIGGA